MSIPDANISIQTDGGLREGFCGAAAWIIGLWGEGDSGCEFQPLIAHGTFLQVGATVFETEAI